VAAGGGLFFDRRLPSTFSSPAVCR
jgi:hypothetical protein